MWLSCLEPNGADICDSSKLCLSVVSKQVSIYHTEAKWYCLVWPVLCTML